MKTWAAWIATGCYLEARALRRGTPPLSHVIRLVPRGGLFVAWLWLAEHFLRKAKAVSK